MNTDGDYLFDSCLWSGSEIAPAKINLGLKLIGQRTDGYHLIESLFWPIELCDELSIRPHNKNDAVSVELESSHGIFEDTLVTKTIAKLRHYIHFPRIRVQIQKRIPIGGGLGGGSSNAAALIRFVGSRANLSIKRMEEIALSLGADVPFFLSIHKGAWVTGIGEKRKLFDIDRDLANSIRFALIIPPFESSTNNVFKSYRSSLSPFSESRQCPFTGTIDLCSLKNYFKEMRNDLIPFVRGQENLISNILQFLRKCGALTATMSGTGSTVFGVFEDEASLEKVSQELFSFCRKYSCRLVVASTFRD